MIAAKEAGIDEEPRDAARAAAGARGSSSPLPARRADGARARDRRADRRRGAGEHRQGRSRRPRAVAARRARSQRRAGGMCCAARIAEVLTVGKAAPLRGRGCGGGCRASTGQARAPRPPPLKGRGRASGEPPLRFACEGETLRGHARRRPGQCRAAAGQRRQRDPRGRLFGPGAARGTDRGGGLSGVPLRPPRRRRQHRRKPRLS